MTGDPDRLLDEVAYLADAFGWSLGTLLDLEHPDRRRFIEFCQREPAEETDTFPAPGTW